jgi:hypothetical protein
VNIADKLNEFGRAAVKNRDLGQAVILFQRAIEKAPKDPAYWNNLGRAYFLRSDYTRAEHAFNQAISLDLNYPIARQGRAHLRLLRGDYSGGWSDYRWRYRAADGGKQDRIADRINLKGRAVVLYRDLGLGDEIFFLRWLAELKAIAPRVKYAPDPRLFHMLKRAGVPVLESEDEGEVFESIADLPFLLKSYKTPKSIKLIPHQPTVDDIRIQLERMGPKPWIGYTNEAGTRDAETSLHKFVPLERLIPAIKGPWTLINVTRKRSWDMSGTGSFEAENPEVCLALMSLLDEYVAVSNTNVHFRAALGLKSRVLVPDPPEFRWGLGDKSPFFPECAVYRQTGAAWLPALNMLKEDLWQRLSLTN